MAGTVHDIAIVGGGINGCGIARDAAGRGLKVVLLEQNDLAGATSSASTKLVHGGLRYLEHYKFRLVREALIEREVILRMAPHIVWPLRFVLPHHSGLRPAWLLRLGLFFYDTLGGRRILSGTRTIDLKADPAGQPLKPLFSRGFEYSDCWVEDSRLVVLNAMDAAARGARVETRSKVVSARREDGAWTIDVARADGEGFSLRARVLVNAAGPWIGGVLSGIVRSNTPERVRMVQGSHIVVKKLFDHDRAYMFQNADDRIIFAIPYERDFTLIGTTDLDYHGDPAAVAISSREVTYLCDAASEYFVKRVTPADVVWTYSGVRPLYDDGASKAQEATRDYVLTLEAGGGQPTLLNVFGGKITTYRKLAEAVMERLHPHLSFGAAWTHDVPLPGGAFAVEGFDSLVEDMAKRAPFVPRATVRRWVRAYGTRTAILLDGITDLAGLGHVFGADLFEAEVAYLIRHEWARSAADVLWRRSKLGLRLSAAQIEALDLWMLPAVARELAA
jgi:glycerol-3-phosphate dehydrogenase